MIEIIPFENDKVFGIRAEGKLQRAEFESLLPEMEAKLARHKRIRIYAEIETFTGFTLSALMADMKFATKHLTHFEKEAIVTDKKWLASASNTVGKLVPGIEIRAFSTEDIEEAKRWISA